MDDFTTRELEVISAAFKALADYEAETQEQKRVRMKVDEEIADRLFARL